MGVIAHPDDLGSMFAQLERRISDLERTKQAQFALRVQSTTNPAVTSVEAGHLAALGNSPAHDGIRVLDPASGALVFDTLGVQQSLAVLANIDTISPTQGTTAGLTTWADVSGATITYSLSRQQTILLLGTASVAMVPNKFGALQFVTDGGSPSTYLLWSDASISAFNGYAPGTLFQVLTLAAGSHTSKWQMATTPGGVGNMNVNTASLYAFLMGG